MLRQLEGWFFALSMLILRATCRVRIHNDPRVSLREAGTPYAYSILHAQQIAAAINREPGTAAMVSASKDGELLMPGFRALGIKAIRGSSNSKHGDKGGRRALSEMIGYLKVGSPAIMAVDGPKGPRNHVRKGIAVLSRDSNAAVLNVLMVPTRRWVLRGIWDRLQIPKPFCRIDAYFAEPLLPTEGESVEKFRLRIERSLNDLEREHDPSEATTLLAVAAA
ncbi:MAG: lysophospholipid acyltransferase family protein [Planctomycetota bacterium]